MKCFKVYVQTFKGVLKGKRKADFQSLEVGYAKTSFLDDENAQADFKLMAMKVLEENLKSIPDDIHLAWYPCEILDEEKKLERLTLTPKKVSF